MSGSSDDMACGVYTWFGFLLPMEERLRLIRDAGFRAVCTWWGDTFSESDGRRETQLGLAARYGLCLEHAHLSYFGCDALWRDGVDGDALLKTYENDVDAAALCGVGTLVFHPFEKTVPQHGDWGAFSGRFLRLTDRCERRGVRLAVENLADWPCLCRILDELAGDNPAVGLCFDAGHANIVSHNDFSLLSRYADRLFALHLHDNNGQKDQHLLPYGGNIDWRGLLGALSKTAYRGSFMLEAGYPFDYENADADQSAAFIQPPIPAADYLSDAMRACRRALRSPSRSN